MFILNIYYKEEIKKNILIIKNNERKVSDTNNPV